MYELHHCIKALIPDAHPIVVFLASYALFA